MDGVRVCGSALETLKLAKADYKNKVDRILRPPAAPVPALPLFEDYASEVLHGPFRERLAVDLMAPKTWQLYEQILRLNIEGSSLGGMTLGQIAPSDVERWAMALMTQERVLQDGKNIIPSRPMASASKRRYIVMLESIFEYARTQDKILIFNPARGWKKPPEEKVDYRILNAKEVEELLALCPEIQTNTYDMMLNRRRRLITLMGLVGLGPAEMCGLKKEDLDAEGLNPTRQIQRLGNLGIQTRDRLKTDARKNWIPLEEELLTLLTNAPEGWILVTDIGTPMEPGNLRRCFAGMVEGTKFAGMKPYDLRHTFAMRLIEAGVDVQSAAEMMRHSVEVFLRRYVRSDRARKLAAIRKLRDDSAQRKNDSDSS